MKRLFNKNLVIIFFAIAVLAVVSGCGRKPPIPPLPKGEQTETATSSFEIAEIATSTSETAVPPVQSGLTGTSTEDVDTADWKVYRNTEYGFEVRYPEDFKKTEIVGEFYNNEEYPRMGVAFLDPKTEMGTFKEVGVTIYDKGWVGLGPDLADPQIFDFNKKRVKDIAELKNMKEFSNGEIINIKDHDALKIDKNYNLYVIVQNPINLKFIIFSTIRAEGREDYKKINEDREKLLMQVLNTINFIKNSNIEKILFIKVG